MVEWWAKGKQSLSTLWFITASRPWCLPWFHRTACRAVCVRNVPGCDVDWFLMKRQPGGDSKTRYLRVQKGWCGEEKNEAKTKTTEYRWQGEEAFPLSSGQKVLCDKLSHTAMRPEEDANLLDWPVSKFEVSLYTHPPLKKLCNTSHPPAG